MSINGDVTVYQLPPGSPTTIGVNLGNPVRTFKPESLIQKGSKEPVLVTENSQRERVKRSAAKKSVSNAHQRFRLSKEEYLAIRQSGLSRDSVCNKYNIALGTLRTYLHQWGIGSVAQEEAALKEVER